VVLVVVACVGCAGSTRNVPLGTVADAGFRPTVNGFEFANYGDALPDGSTPTNLTAADMRALFGNRVCADLKIGQCDLIPEAQAWLDATNAEMAGGHCYGFAVLAALLWDHKVTPTTFGAATTANLNIANPALQRGIAYYWAQQLLTSVQSKKVDGTPHAVLAALEQAVRPHPKELYTIVFWKRDGTGGHAVTPYAVDNDGNGRFRVLIYDNNWPGQTHEINFDTKADMWTYYASTQPDDGDSLYEGDAKSRTLQLYPTLPGLGTQPCPFCGRVQNGSSRAHAEALASSAQQELVLLSGATHGDNVVISDAAGHRLGVVNGRVVDQMSGAQADNLAFDSMTAAEPVFHLPADRAYTITLTSSRTADSESIELIGPSSDVAVHDISVAPASRTVLHVEPNAAKVTFTSSRPQTPSMQLGVNEDAAQWSFTVDGLVAAPGSTTTLSLPAKGDQLVIEDTFSRSASDLSFIVARSTPSGVLSLHREDVALAPGARTTLDFSAWPELGLVSS
jgi:hypothetical protein